MKPLSSATAAGGVPSLLSALGLDDELGRMAWLEGAVCGQSDPELFFPSQGGSNAKARRICMSCEVRTYCLEWAIQNGESDGVWGGMVEHERRAYARINGMKYGAGRADLRDLMPGRGPMPEADEDSGDEAAA